MTKTFAKKLVATIGRTVAGVIIAVLGVLSFLAAWNWQIWCPNNDLGLILTLLIYSEAMMLFGYGVYLTATLRIEKVAHRLLKEACKRDLISSSEEEDMEDELRYRKKIREIRKKYLW